MKKHLLAAGAAAVVGAFLAPGVVLADPSASPTQFPKGHPIMFLALPELDRAGKPVTVSIRQGETAPVTIGAAPLLARASSRSSVQVVLGRGLDLPRTFDNCWYFVNGDDEGAWCSFDPVGATDGTFALANFEVAAEPTATPGETHDIRFVWFGAPATDSGLRGLAQAESGPGTSPVQGTAGTLTLVKAPQLVKEPTSAEFAVTRVRVMPPEHTDQGDVEPTAKATPNTGTITTPRTHASPTTGTDRTKGGDAGTTAPTPSATRFTPAAAAQAPDQLRGGSAGSLASTGSTVALVVAISALLVMVGVVVVALSRRKRFVA